MRYQVIPVTPFQQNCSILWSETTLRAAVIDPGGEIDRILAELERLGVGLEKILITHAHVDHAGGAAELARRTGAPIEGPQREDLFWIERMEQQGEAFGYSGGEPFEPTRWLEQGDRVEFGGEELEVLHCPGHTPGHVVFFHRPTETAFVGDVLFQGSIGRTDFPRGDHEALLRAIRERLWPLGDAVTFIPGHGPDSTIGAERRSNPFVGDRVLGG